MNPPVPEKLSEAEALRHLAREALSRNPAMYLMALRTHLSRGRTAIGDLIQSVIPRDSLSAKTEQEQ